MDKGSFGVHQIEFVIQPSPSFIDSRGIRQATNGTHNFGLVSARHDGRWLIVDANLRKEKLGIDLAMHNAISSMCLELQFSRPRWRWVSAATIASDRYV